MIKHILELIGVFNMSKENFLISASIAKENTTNSVSLVKLNNILSVIKHYIKAAGDNGAYKISFHQGGDIFNQSCYASQKAIELYKKEGYEVEYCIDGKHVLSLSWKNLPKIQVDASDEKVSHKKVIIHVAFDGINSKIVLYRNKNGIYISTGSHYYFDPENKLFGVVPDLTDNLSNFELKTSSVIHIEYVTGDER